MTIPCRFRFHAANSSGLSFISGYTFRNCVEIRGLHLHGRLASLYMPPNQLNVAAAFTPLVARIFS